MENNFLDLTQLNQNQIHQYRQAVAAAFPAITQHSAIIKSYWDRIEKYFPQHQVFMLDNNGDILGFINTIPFSWKNSLDNLPEEGWDWMVMKGVADHENKLKPNCLGGLQVIIPKRHLGKGYSKHIISELKQRVKQWAYQYFIIPIRPTLKKLHPEMKMSDYLLFKQEGKIYDPWIRTHLNSGANILKVCSKSMTITGDLTFWKTVVNSKIEKSGFYNGEGALNKIEIQVENDYGVYYEENIWIYYQ